MNTSFLKKSWLKILFCVLFLICSRQAKAIRFGYGGFHATTGYACEQGMPGTGYACEDYSWILSIIDSSIGNTDTWVCTSLPTNGAISSSFSSTFSVGDIIYSCPSTGGVLFPSIGYCPNTDFVGSDSFNIIVFNNVGDSDYITLYINVMNWPSPFDILGEHNLCLGLTTSFHDDGDSGGIWSTTDSTIATINSFGQVTALSLGSTSISYSFASSMYCPSMSCTFDITVIPTPLVGTISGAANLCLGSTITLSDTASGGIWSAVNANATVSGGLVTGISSGIDSIHYSVTNGCGTAVASYVITINPLPIADTITGATSVCVGANTLLSDVASGGIWSTTNANASVSSGVVTGISWGVDTIQYTVTNSCGTAVAMYVITVNPLPVAGTITGATSVCLGSIITLSDTASGGTWSTANSNATVLGGVVTGVMAGTDSIHYSVINSCGTAVANYAITVNPLPNAGIISGVASVCVGASITLSDAASGGTWSTANANATVSSGVVTGVLAGTDSIQYSVINSCGTAVATYAITVNPLPNAGIITGVASVCVGANILLSDASSGGVWSTSNANATVSGGVVTGVATGTDSIEYTVTNSCGTAFATHVITINPLPVAGFIAGDTSVCVGATIVLSDLASGGVWSTTNSNATVSGGIVTGAITGPDSILYFVTNSCGTAFAIHGITVNPLPNAGTITGVTSVCVGATIVLSDVASGGTWSATNANAIVSGGAVTGVIAGIDSIQYSVTNSCGTDIASYSITINALPVISTSFIYGCGVDTLSATGATAYSWMPTTGLSCDTCAITQLIPTTTFVYTVIGTTAGCSSFNTITADGNRISGTISFSSTPPISPSLKVWLIQYNSIDSTLTGIDSTITCIETGTTSYYQFIDKPAGNYMVKASLIGSIPGTSGYMPTYSYTTSHWDSATNIAHISSADTLPINMNYGTVPSGSGFISGLIVMGAGKGTSGEIPASEILVYLEDTLNNIYTYTYSDTSGSYSFSGLAFGSYIIYPTDYKYYTTQSSIITLNSTTPTDSFVNFKKHTTLGTITPFVTSGITNLLHESKFQIYPNPTKDILNISWSNISTGVAEFKITDLIGHGFNNQQLKFSTISGNSQIDISNLQNGIYFISIKGETVNYFDKIQVLK